MEKTWRYSPRATSSKLTAVTAIVLSPTASSIGQNGGNLTLIAGYSFTPATMGQVGPNLTSYTLTGPSATGGNIQLGNTTINTNTTLNSSNGGNVQAYAYGVAGGNAGTIAIKSIDTSATGA